MLSVKLIALLALLGGAFSPAVFSADSSLSGRVIAAAINGQGRGGDSKGRASGRQDIWWTYCISTADQSYSVTSRYSPAKSGLVTDRVVRFSVKRGQVFLLDPTGKQISLRIERKGEAGKCPWEK